MGRTVGRNIDNDDPFYPHYIYDNSPVLYHQLLVLLVVK